MNEVNFPLVQYADAKEVVSISDAYFLSKMKETDQTVVSGYLITLYSFEEFYEYCLNFNMSSLRHCQCMEHPGQIIRVWLRFNTLHDEAPYTDDHISVSIRTEADNKISYFDYVKEVARLKEFLSEWKNNPVEFWVKNIINVARANIQARM